MCHPLQGDQDHIHWNIQEETIRKAEVTLCNLQDGCRLEINLKCKIHKETRLRSPQVINQLSNNFPNLYIYRPRVTISKISIMRPEVTLCYKSISINHF